MDVNDPINIKSGFCRLQDQRAYKTKRIVKNGC